MKDTVLDTKLSKFFSQKMQTHYTNTTKRFGHPYYNQEKLYSYYIRCKIPRNVFPCTFLASYSTCIHLIV